MTMETTGAAASWSEGRGGRLTIDLVALVENWRFLAARAGAAECAAAVKGDGYGTGLEQAVTALSAAGCRTFFVALPEEGVRARAIAPQATIHVLNGLFEEAVELYLAHGLIPVLGSLAELRLWADAALKRGTKLPATLHVDTGMNRMGLRVEEALGLAAAPGPLSAIDLKLVISHLACADAPDHALTALQLERFRRVAAAFPGVRKSLANSAGILTGPEFHFDLVRPGIALYGGRALAGRPNPMRTVVTLEGRIMLVRMVPKGETVGYGAAETCTRDSRIAILSIGYADGFHRAAGGTDAVPGARAAIDGRPVRLFGRISMDLLALDVTDLPDGLGERGQWVELFGPRIPVDEVAAHAGTIGYELLTGLGRRYGRRYLGDLPQG